MIYEGDKLKRIQSRAHDELVEFNPTRYPFQIYFYATGHTPVLRVRNRKKDVDQSRLDPFRRSWLDFCYHEADREGWPVQDQPELAYDNPPKLDDKNWLRWGKHSVYLDFTRV